MYKYIDKYRIERAKPYIKQGDKVVTNPPVEMLSELGYKPIAYGDVPIYDEDTEYLVPIYTDMKDCILCEYEIVLYETGVHKDV
jgi:hypothetical protein